MIERQTVIIHRVFYSTFQPRIQDVNPQVEIPVDNITVEMCACL
jgi:hypothetical protein